jgi:hypothetical protein
MANVQTAENRAARRLHLEWKRSVPLALFFLFLASCAPTPAPAGGTIQPVNVPPHHSPIYTNQEQLTLSFENNPTTNDQRKKTVAIDLNGHDASGNSCDDHLSSKFTEPSYDQSAKGITPFDVIVSANGEEGSCKVEVRTQQCVEQSCSGWQDEPFSVEVVFDTTAPKVEVTGNNPGTIQGTAIDANPLQDISVRSIGENPQLLGNAASAEQDGKFTVLYRPEVGPKSVSVEVQDAAGNVGKQTVTSDYEFNMGLSITKMQVDGKQINLTEFSKIAGRKINDGDIFVGAELPSGIDPNTVSLSGEQANWRKFGFTSKLQCGKIAPNGFDVAFVCTPASTSSDKARLKFNFTDQYGYSFEMEYPQEAFFTVETRSMNMGELAWFITERALAILAALTVAGLGTAITVNSKRYGDARQKALSLADIQNVRDAFTHIDSVDFLTDQQRNRLKSQVNGHMEAKRQAVLMAEHKGLINELYVFPMAYIDYRTALSIPHKAMKEATDNLSRALQLGYKTNYLQDIRRRSDDDAVTEQFSAALERWMDLYILNSTKEPSHDWKKVEEGWGENKDEILAVLNTLHKLQTRPEYASLLSRVKHGKQSLLDKVNEITLVYAYNNNLLIRNGTIDQRIYTHLVAHNMEIEDVISTLMKWGSTGVGEFIGQIRDEGQRKRATKYFQKFFDKR